MRRGEALGLTRDRVNLKERMILLRPEDVKERRWKRVPIHRDLVPVLEEVLKVRSIGSDKIFLINGRAPNEDSLRKPWTKAVKELEFDPAPRLHDLRHTWKTNAMRSGMDPEIRESIMGHWFRGKTVAERYGRISDAGFGPRDRQGELSTTARQRFWSRSPKRKTRKSCIPPSGKMLTNC